MRTWIALAAFIVITFGAAAFGAIYTPGPWYDALAKPSWNPPSWLFGPVWTALYLAMAVAAWRVWRRRPDPRVPSALVLYFAQLTANAAWSFLFFGLHRMDLAFADIALLWILIGVTTFVFARLDRLAAGLLVPYWLWVSFAAALNYTLWQMN